MPKLPGVVRLSVLVVLAGGVAHDLSGQTSPQGGASPSSALQSYQKAPTGFILGQVLDAGTGQPIAGATVTLGGGAAPGAPNGAAGSPDGAVLVGPAAQAALAAARNANRLLTGASGQFVFHDLRAGNYRISAAAPGYVPGAYGQHRVNGNSRTIQLTEDEHVGDATIRLWKYASLSGRVLDDIGEPAVGVNVRVLRAQVMGARRTWLAAPSAQTDDRGLYRAGNLVPGDYVVAVPQTMTTMPVSVVDAYRDALTTGSATDLQRELNASGVFVPGLFGGGMRIGNFELSGSGMLRTLPLPQSGDPDEVYAYQSAFYPTASSSADATILTLTSGQDQTGIDLQLRLVRTVKVSGTVTGPDGPAKNTGVRLVPLGSQEIQNDNGFETAQSVTDASGAFTFLGVPSGQYVAKVQRLPRTQVNQMAMVTVMSSSGGFTSFTSAPADLGAVAPSPPPTEPSLFGEASVAVAEHDVDGVAVTLRAGAKVSGKVVFEGSAAAPTPDMLLRLTVTLTAVDGGNPAQLSAPPRASADGRFTTFGYPPGRYRVNVVSPFPQWSLRSVTLGGRNLDDTPLELNGDDVTGVVVTFSDQTTQINGTVHAASGATVDEGDVSVFAFPSNYMVWIDQGMSNRRQASAPTAKSGTYSLSGLPPGDYLIVAVNADAIGSMRDTKFFDTLARSATHVTLSDGEKRSLDLTVSTIR